MRADFSLLPLYVAFSDNQFEFEASQPKGLKTVTIALPGPFYSLSFLIPKIFWLMQFLIIPIPCGLLHIISFSHTLSRTNIQHILVLAAKHNTFLSPLYSKV